MWYRTPRAALPALLAAVLLAGCGGATRADDGDPAKVTAVAGFYPLHYLATRVGGAGVEVTNLARPGVEPHDMELTPSQLDAVARAELVVTLRGVQPAVDRAAAGAGDRLFDLAAQVPLDPAAAGPDGHGGEEAGHGEEPGHDDGAATDPHFWLDTDRYAAAAGKLAGRLAAVDPAGAPTYQANAAAFTAELRQLDAQYRTGLASCARRQIITSHAAFGYLARRYGLTQIPISGISPEQEPQPRRMAEVAALARQHRATTIFFESLVDPKIAQTVARQAGVGTSVLDPVEGVQGADDYPRVMQRNLATLRQALGCR